MPTQVGARSRQVGGGTFVHCRMPVGDEHLTAEQRHLADIARGSAKTLLRLLDDVLDFSKLEAGALVINETDCAPVQIVETLVEVFQAAAHEKGITLSAHLPPTLSDMVVTDAARLRQVLFNLVGNGIKFTDAGHVVVRARRGDDLADGRFLLEFEVEDTGIGIPAEAIPSLFDRFTQADSSITRRYGGTGLGLAICRELCTLMGGTIRVSSAAGWGSVFQFAVACRASDPRISPVAAPPVSETDLSIPLPPLRVLVVDDNVVNREIARAMLQRKGHTVMLACDGRDAVRLAGEGAFDVVLIDVQMPEMDGLAATSMIRGLPVPWGCVPVIALTAHTSENSRLECLAAGMNGFVTKPIRLAALLEEIALVANGHPAETVSQESVAERCELLDSDQMCTIADALGSEGWQSLIDGFIRGAEEQIMRMHDTWDAGGDDYRRAAYTLKGMSWNVGARELGNVALRGKSASPSDARMSTTVLQSIFKKTVLAFKSVQSSAIVHIYAPF